MRKLLPDYITAKFIDNEYNGTIKAHVLSADIKGFTSLTEDLKSLDSEGSEKISVIINILFSVAVDLIYSYGGFITVFAGDAFTAVFPDITYSEFNSCKKSIINHILNNNVFETPLGKREIFIKIGDSYGDVHWSITGDSKLCYYFHGEPIINAASNQKLYSKTFNIAGSHDADTSKHINESIMSQFFSKSILNSDSSGDFRYLCPVFIQFSACNDREKFIISIIDTAAHFRGYFNKVEYGDKGWMALCIFGAPDYMENPPDSALAFADEILKTYKDIGIGITYGKVFAGFIGGEKQCEYTVLGNIVNLSARLANISNSYGLYIDKAVMDNSKNIQLAVKKHNLKLKGIADNVNAYYVDKMTEGVKISSDAIIGRKNELELIKKWSIERKNGKQKMLLIDGYPGIGKSFLIERYISMNNISTNNVLRVNNNAVQHGSFSAFINAIRIFLGLTGSPDNTAFINEIKHFNIDNNVKNILGFILNIDPTLYTIDNIPITERKNTIITALAEFLNTIDIHLLFIDDIQWMDSDSIAVLIHLLSQSSLLIAATSRLDEKGNESNVRINNKYLQRIKLNFLNNDETSLQIGYLLSGKPSEELSSLIYSKSEGNPFYVKQIVKYLSENKLFNIRNNEYYIVNNDIPLPANLHNLVLSRISKMTNNTFNAIKTASVLGLSFSINILKHMLNLPNAVDIIKEAVAYEIWQTTGDMVEFSHSTFMETAYSTMLKQDRKALHEKAAQSFIGFHSKEGQYFGTIAYHFEQAGNKKNMIEYYLKAGDWTRYKYFFDDSKDFYQKVLDNDDNPSNTLRARGNIATMYKYEGYAGKAIEYFRQNVSEANQTDNLVLKGITLFQYGESLTYITEYSSALKHLKKAKKYLQKANHGYANLVNVDIGNIYYFMEQYSDALISYKIGIEYMKKTNDFKHMAIVKGNISTINKSRGKIKKAIKLINYKMKIMIEINDKMELAKTLFDKAQLYALNNKFKLSAALFSEAYDKMSELGSESNMAIGIMKYSLLYIQTGNIEEALNCINKSLQHSINTKNKPFEMSVRTVLSQLYLLTGNLKKTKEQMNIVLSQNKTFAHQFDNAILVNSVLLVLSGKNEDALSHLKHMSLPRSSEQTKTRRCLKKIIQAEIYMRMGNKKHCKTLYRKVFNSEDNIMLRIISNIRYNQLAGKPLNDGLNKFIYITEIKTDINAFIRSIMRMDRRLNIRYEPLKLARDKLISSPDTEIPVFTLLLLFMLIDTGN